MMQPRAIVKTITIVASAIVLVALGVLLFGAEAAIGSLSGPIVVAVAVIAFAGLIFLQATAPNAPKTNGPMATVLFAALIVVVIILLFFVFGYEFR